MLWFNFILGSVFIFLCSIFIITHCYTQKQRKITIEPRKKLNHNVCPLRTEQHCNTGELISEASLD